MKKTRSKPLIGITTDTRENHNQIEAKYSEAVAKNGGIPMLIPTNSSKSVVSATVARMDGILIPGSRDMDPKHYKQKPHPKLRPMDAERTVAEFEVTRTAVSLRKPILGICGGMQLINVYFGGSLYQDLKSLVPEALEHENGKEHKVRIEKNTTLRSIVKVPEITVKSYHHQSVDKIGKNLMVSGLSNDDMVEALESKGEHFILGVQWHPELETTIYSKRIFRRFIDESRNY